MKARRATLRIWLGGDGWFWEAYSKQSPGQAHVHMWNKSGVGSKASARRAALRDMKRHGLTEAKAGKVD